MEPKRAPLILAVEHNRRNLELLTQVLSQDGYRLVAVTSLEELGRVLNAEQHFSLALVDISGFGQQIWHHCEHLRQRQVPFLVLASNREVAGLQHGGHSHGAHSVLAKPMRKKELRLLLNGFCGPRDAPDTVATGP